MPTLMLQC